MEEKREPEQTATPSLPRVPYVRPQIVFLGDVMELTRGASGSVGDGVKGKSQSGSTIRLKKDVAYLDEAQRAAVARDLLSLRLATWEYKDPTVSGQRHLGIIIEDAPEVAAVHPSKESIDLYSYASMAIAAAQVQAKEIGELRAQVETLRAELATLKR